MGGKGGGGSPMPDFAGIMAAQAAQHQADVMGQIAQDQLSWAKQQYAEDKKTNQPIIDNLVKMMGQQNDYASQQMDTYNNTYLPIEKDLAQKETNWDTPQREEQQAGMAGADVAQQFEGARQAAAQQLKDFGIDPTSPRYASTDLQTRLGQAQSEAGAENMARQNTQMQGMSLEQNAVNTGRGYAGAINQTFGGAQNAGNSAVSNTLNQSQTGANMMGTPYQYYGLQNNAISNWGNIANNNYQNYLQGYKIQNQPQSSGIGSALGLAGGLLGGMMHFAEGGTVPDQSSPTGGNVVDDVPAQLTAGEFVMPKRAVEWFGEKHFHDIIAKADKERGTAAQQSGAVPTTAPATGHQPTFISRGQPAAALPVG